MPLEGLEHVLSILHRSVKRQIPRNYAAFRSVDHIAQRPKTASWKYDAAKRRAKLTSLGAALREVTRVNVGKTKFACG